MRYCTRCLMPDTKPYIAFNDEGVCSACISHEKKDIHLQGIDWDARRSEFEKLIKGAERCNAPYYDVLVPVSGGKDSLTQLHRVLQYDVRVLAVNIDYGIKTEVGRYNLSRVPEMGASLLTVRPALPLHKRLIRIGLEEFGDPDLLSHTMLHAYPIRTALQFGIPLVMLGENSAFEYGGDEGLAGQNQMTREWFEKYAANAGRDAPFISDNYDIPMKDLICYDFPDELEKSETTKAVFMSYYFPWDSHKHLEIAKQYGFKCLGHPSEGTFRSFVGIDEKINRIHQCLKVLKFGYGRATDHACEDIRNGRLTREEAKALVREHDLKPLSDYYTDDFCEYAGYQKQEFLDILERYRNTDIWQKGASGKWIIPHYLED